MKEQQIVAPLGVDEMAEWYNPFVIVPKPNGTVCLCLDPTRPTLVLIRAIQNEPTIYDTLHKLTNVHYMTIIDASSG